MSSPSRPALKMHSAPENHGQFVADPVAHFAAIPWCAALLHDPAVLQVIVPERQPLPSGESNFVRKTMNSGSTVRACVTFIRPVRSSSKKSSSSSSSSETPPPLSRCAELLTPGGAAAGETPQAPFLLFGALLDLGEDCASYASTLHGGLYGVLLDEVMGTAANTQSANGAYTVSFTTTYRRAVKLPQIVLVRGRVVRKEGRKIWMRGTIEDKDGNIMAEGQGMWLAMAQNVGRSQL
ncbi:HotDog domain-containing protein [Xylariaceae sp. FL0016]|nr:HotDog domain-containing protein [Xylariaceae sp. FL0016]